MKLGMITNGSVRMQNAKIDEIGVRSFFETIIVSDEIGIKKPDIRIFNMVLKKLNVNAKNAIYIGDNPFCDIKGASNAGLNTAWMEGFREWDLDGIKPDYKINHLKELLSII
ncbi:HAD family hydrolase [Natronospora cellulosivora (SeqCode)]